MLSVLSCWLEFRHLFWRDGYLLNQQRCFPRLYKSLSFGLNHCLDLLLIKDISRIWRKGRKQATTQAVVICLVLILIWDYL